MITVTSSGGEEVFLKLESAYRITDFAIRKAWFATGADLKRTAITESRKKPRQGNVYIIRTKSGRRRRHVASRPGESHASMTGKLTNSIQWKVHGPDLQFGYGTANGQSPEYDAYMERGTKRMAARPTLGNSVQSNKRNAENNLLQFVKLGFE